MIWQDIDPVNNDYQDRFKPISCSAQMSRFRHSNTIENLNDYTWSIITGEIRD